MLTQLFLLVRVSITNSEDISICYSVVLVSHCYYYWGEYLEDFVFSRFYWRLIRNQNYQFNHCNYTRLVDSLLALRVAESENVCA